MRELRGHHQGNVARRHRTRRRVEQRRRRHPRHHRGRVARDAGQLEGLHLRRGAPAQQSGLRGTVEDARRTAAARRVRARDDRPAQGHADHSLAYATPRVPTLQRRHAQLVVARSREGGRSQGRRRDHRSGGAARARFGARRTQCARSTHRHGLTDRKSTGVRWSLPCAW